MKPEEVDKKAIQEVLQKLNDCWHQKQYDKMGAYIAEEVVIVPPGSSERVRGRESYIQSYKDYDSAAVTTEFLPGELQIDLFGDIAVVLFPFFIAYELQGISHREHGKEALLLKRTRETWQILWRTMESESE
jgi:ketosteroid isomerase-like protein